MRFFIKASFATCQERDVKGLYDKADKGMVKTFTGKGSAFEEPNNDCLVIDSEKENQKESADKLFEYILRSISMTQ